MCIRDRDKANVRAKAYDLVLNGVELSSGSIRITDPTLQNRIFSLLGLSAVSYTHLDVYKRQAQDAPDGFI